MPRDRRRRRPCVRRSGGPRRPGPGSGLLLIAILLTAGAGGSCVEESAPGAGSGESPDAGGVPADPGGEPITVVDAEGRTVSLPDPPDRIVSLVPSASQVLLELGARHRLVGRTEHDTLAALAGLPSVGGGLHPSLEVLVALEPDLVVRFAGETDRETPARLDRSGVPHLAVAPESVADVRDLVLELGRIVGRAAAADSLVATIDDGLAEVRSRVEGLPPVRTAFVMAGSPPWVAGPGTFIHELITLAGGQNVFGDLERRWAAVSPEALVGREPDVLITPTGTRLDPRVTASSRVRTVSTIVQLPGPHLPRAAREVARALRPDRFR